MTKRVGYIIEKVADEDNIRRAIKNSQKGGKAKRSRQIRDFNALYAADPEGVIAERRRMILELDFPEHRSRINVKVSDAGKLRRIDNEDYDPWKWLSWAIMQVIEPILTPKLYGGAVCCVKGRGMVYGSKMLGRMMRRDPQLWWYAQSDCKKYYPSLSHDWLRKVFAHHFKDKRFLKLLDICVLDYDCGADIRNEIEDEKARHKDWLLSERTDWQPRPRRDRPHPRAKVQG